MNATAPSLDDLLKLLANPYRRRLLLDLLDGRSIEVGTDATVAADGSGERSSPPEAQVRHVHLPKLADANLIDRDAGASVRRGPAFETAEPLLRAIDAADAYTADRRA